MPREIIVATGNQGKLREIRNLLYDMPITLKSLADFTDLKMPLENGETFFANARQKALAVVEKTGGWVLADDSGLVVPSLNGEPGIYSARYAGVDADDRKNNLYLLAKLQNIPAIQRQAWFVCVMVLATPSGEIHQFEGRCEGRIASSMKGNEGFGYDPLFLLAPYYTKTMAEINLAEKQRISHRGMALRQLKEWLLVQ
ncbi:MAG: XTP/dITP diphosphatase [Deltaproteobacteria bacterium]|nr:XTP/dITP diphosphatase [Deltaproteobacteria bacterium]